MFIVSVINMELPFRGGIHKYEEMLLQRIRMSVEVQLDSSHFIQNRTLVHTLDYTALSEICKQVSLNVWGLLEDMAIEINNQIRKKCPLAQDILISIKKTPSLGLAYDHVEVQLKTTAKSLT